MLCQQPCWVLKAQGEKLIGKQTTAKLPIILPCCLPKAAIRPLLFLLPLAVVVGDHVVEEEVRTVQD